MYYCTPKVSPHPPPLGWCDGSQALTTHQLQVERGETVIEPVQWMEIIRRPWLARANEWNVARTPGLHPYLLFTRGAMGFLMTRESQDLFFTSHPKYGACYSICPHHFTGVLGPTYCRPHRVSAPLTNTSTSSNLVFSAGLPSRFWPSSALLSFSGLLSDMFTFLQFYNITIYLQCKALCVDAMWLLGCFL